MQNDNSNVCSSGDCIPGMSKLKEIGLSLEEKKTIFLNIVVDGGEGGRQVSIPSPLSWGRFGRVPLA